MANNSIITLKKNERHFSHPAPSRILLFSLIQWKDGRDGRGGGTKSQPRGYKKYLQVYVGGVQGIKCETCV